MNSNNKNLKKARTEKNDEFYTQFSDVERGLHSFGAHFKGAHVFNNCDDAEKSQFFSYFYHNFKTLNLGALTSIGYRKGCVEVPLSSYDGRRVEVRSVSGDGAFDSHASTEILKKCDVVVTNPPFSLFREYFSHLVGSGKKFTIMGPLNAALYVDIFPLIRDGKVCLGEKMGAVRFSSQGGSLSTPLGNIVWLTNLELNPERTPLVLSHTYIPEKYPKYDNYDAVEVSRVGEIPYDYMGVMGVPTSFLLTHAPSQFKVLGSSRGVNQDPAKIYGRSVFLRGKETYQRIFIQRVG